MEAPNEQQFEQWRADLKRIKFGRHPHFATVQCFPSMSTTSRILEMLGRIEQESLPKGSRPSVSRSLGIYITPDPKTSDIVSLDPCCLNSEWDVRDAQVLCRDLVSGASLTNKGGETYQSITVIFDAAYISTTPYMMAASAGILRFMADRFKAQDLVCCTAIALTDGDRPFFPPDDQLHEAFGVDVTVTHHQLAQSRPEVVFPVRRSGQDSVYGDAEYLMRHLLLDDVDVDLDLTHSPGVSASNRIIACMADYETATSLKAAFTNDRHASAVKDYAASKRPTIVINVYIFAHPASHDSLTRFLQKIKPKEGSAVVFVVPGARFVVPFSAHASAPHKYLAFPRTKIETFNRRVQQVATVPVLASQLELTLFAAFGQDTDTHDSHSVTILDHHVSEADLVIRPLSPSSAWARDPMTTLFLLAALHPGSSVEQYLSVVAQQACQDAHLTSQLLCRLVSRGLVIKCVSAFGQPALYTLTDRGREVFQFLHCSSHPISLEEAICLHQISNVPAEAAKITLAVMRCILEAGLGNLFACSQDVVATDRARDLVPSPWRSMYSKGPLWAALGLLAVALSGNRPTKGSKAVYAIDGLDDFSITTAFVRNFTKALERTCDLVGLPQTVVKSWRTLDTTDIRAVERTLVLWKLDHVAVAKNTNMDAFALVGPCSLQLDLDDGKWFSPRHGWAPRLEQDYTKFFIFQGYNMESPRQRPARVGLCTFVSSKVVGEVLSEQENSGLE